MRDSTKKSWIDLVNTISSMSGAFLKESEIFLLQLNNFLIEVKKELADDSTLSLQNLYAELLKVKPLNESEKNRLKIFHDVIKSLSPTPVLSDLSTLLAPLASSFTAPDPNAIEKQTTDFKQVIESISTTWNDLFKVASELFKNIGDEKTRNDHQILFVSYAQEEKRQIEEKKLPPEQKYGEKMDLYNKAYFYARAFLQFLADKTLPQAKKMAAEAADNFYKNKMSKKIGAHITTESYMHESFYKNLTNSLNVKTSSSSFFSSPESAKYISAHGIDRELIQFFAGVLSLSFIRADNEQDFKKELADKTTDKKNEISNSALSSNFKNDLFKMIDILENKAKRIYEENKFSFFLTENYLAHIGTKKDNLPQLHDVKILFPQSLKSAWNSLIGSLYHVYENPDVVIVNLYLLKTELDEYLKSEEQETRVDIFLLLTNQLPLPDEVIYLVQKLADQFAIESEKYERSVSESNVDLGGIQSIKDMDSIRFIGQKTPMVPITDPKFTQKEITPETIQKSALSLNFLSKLISTEPYDEVVNPLKQKGIRIADFNSYATLFYMRAIADKKFTTPYWDIFLPATTAKLMGLEYAKQLSKTQDKTKATKTTEDLLKEKEEIAQKLLDAIANIHKLLEKETGSSLPVYKENYTFLQSFYERIVFSYLVGQSEKERNKFLIDYLSKTLDGKIESTRTPPDVVKILTRIKDYLPTVKDMIDEAFLDIRDFSLPKENARLTEEIIQKAQQFKEHQEYQQEIDKQTEQRLQEWRQQKQSVIREHRKTDPALSPASEVSQVLLNNNDIKVTENGVEFEFDKAQDAKPQLEGFVKQMIAAGYTLDIYDFDAGGDPELEKIWQEICQKREYRDHINQVTVPGLANIPSPQPNTIFNNENLKIEFIEHVKKLFRGTQETFTTPSVSLTEYFEFMQFLSNYSKETGKAFSFRDPQLLLNKESLMKEMRISDNQRRNLIAINNELIGIVSNTRGDAAGALLNTLLEISLFLKIPNDDQNLSSLEVDNKTKAEFDLLFKHINSLKDKGSSNQDVIKFLTEVSHEIYLIKKQSTSTPASPAKTMFANRAATLGKSAASSIKNIVASKSSESIPLEKSTLEQAIDNVEKKKSPPPSPVSTPTKTTP